MFTKRSTSRTISVLFNALMILSLLIGSVAFPSGVRADSTITVTTTDDNTASDMFCSLREAIINANKDAQTYPDCIAGSGADIITFSVSGMITLGSTLPIITNTAGLTIDGAGQAVTISGNNTVQVMQVNDGIPLTLNNLRIANGNAGYGGAISNSGGLTITNSAFSSNSATRGGGIYNTGRLSITDSSFSGNNSLNYFGGGGGIYNDDYGALTITNSTFSGNSSAGGGGGGIFSSTFGTLAVTNSTFSGNSANGGYNGGGIYAGSNGTLTIMHSTFSWNSAAMGGGIYQMGTATITNSTFSGNGASWGSGGGIYSYLGILGITNSTITGNIAGGSNGGGIYNDNGAVTVRNTIVADNTGRNCSGVSGITNGGNNIEDGAISTCGWGSTNGSMSSTNPLLGALTGSPAYFPLNSGSPAIDAGNDAICAAAAVNNTSQNGITRPQGMHCDIGSYEAQPALPTPLTVTADNIAITYGDPNPSFTFTYFGFVNGDDETDIDTPPTCVAPGAHDNADTYPIACSGGADNAYTFTYIDGTLMVGPKALTITADNQGKAYFTTLTFSGTEFTVNGLESGDTVTTVTLTSAGAGAAASAGTYPIVPSAAVGTRLNNYAITYVNGLLMVSTSLLIITANDQTKTYGDGFTFAGTEFTVVGLQSGDTVTSVTLTSAGVLSAADVGSYPIVPSAAVGTGLTNYIIVYSNSQMDVNQRNLTFAPNNQTKIYGDVFTAYTGTFTGLQPGDNITPIYDSAGAVATAPVGTYLITVTLDDPDNKLGNYNLIINTSSLTITYRDLVVTPDDKIKVYGDFFTTFTSTIMGVQPGDIIMANYASMGAPSATAVGTYSLSVTLNGPVGVLSNYNVIINTGSLTVTPRNLVITPDDKTKVYGDVFTAFTGAVMGVQPSDNITASYASTGTPVYANVGTYPIAATLNDPLGKLDNYNVTLVTGTLTITARDLVVAPDDKTKIYGDVFTTFTGTLTGIQNSDNITAAYASTGAPASATVGNYPITASLNDLDGKLSNYNATLNTGTLTVLSNIPDLLSPANAEQLLNNQPTFDWTDISGALSYTIQISNNISFTSPTSATVTLSTFTQPTNLPNNVTRYWRVQANMAGGSGPWSVIRSFLTARPPSAPTLASPANNSLTTDYTPLLNWNDSTVPAGTTFQKYELQIATDSAFTSPTSVEVSGAVTNSDYTPSTDLNSNCTYYWRVRAYNTLGQYSAWSAVRSFRTALLPPTLNAPSDAAQLISNRPVFGWDDVAGVTGYRIQIANNIGFSPTLTNTVVTPSTYIPTTDLPAGTTLYWRVQSNGTNGPSAWSTVQTLITANPPGVPTLASPANNAKVSGPSPLFNWNDSTLPVGIDFDYYQIQIATDNGFAVIVHDNNLSGITNSQDGTAVLASGTTYYWRVRAFNTLGQPSAWSAVRSVRFKFAGPTLTLPVTGSTASSLLPTFVWDAINGAATYRIQVSKSSTFNTLVINQTGITSTNFTPTANLQSGTTYYWRVRVDTPTATYAVGDWSIVFTFTTP